MSVSQTGSCFSLVPIDDNIVENPENFTLSLQTTDRAITSSNEANVEIIDTDSKL